MVRRIAFLAASTAVFVTTLVAPAHAAASPWASGTTCGFATTDAATKGFQTGVIFGGPLVLRDTTQPAVVYSGTMTCTVHYGVFNYTHASGGVACSASSAVATVVTVAANLCQFPTTAPFWPDEAYICTQVDIVGLGSLYYSGGGWTTDRNSECERAAYLNLTDEIAQDIKRSTIDPIVCPILAPFFPPYGDVGIFYDCPPYSTVFWSLQYVEYEWMPSVVL